MVWRMMRMKTSVKPTFEWSPFSEKQLYSIAMSDARLNFWEGAVRSGKTIGSIVRWLEYVKTGPPGELLMIGKTERTLKRNILDVIQTMVGSKNYHYNRGTGEVKIYGRKVYVVGANDERSENKIRGMTLAGAYGDEITLWPENFFKMLLTRLSVRGAKFFGTTNPDSPHHWLKIDYLDKKGLNMKRFSFVIDDNLSLDPDYVDSLKAEFSGVFYDRFILGKWVLAEGLVFKEFNDAIHKVPKALIRKMIKDRKFKYFIGGTDWGYTHPMVGLIIGVTHDNVYYLVDEFYETEHQTEDLAKWYQDREQDLIKQPIRYIWCDSAEPDRIITLQSSPYYLNAVPARKDIKAGLNSVNTAYKNNRLFIGDNNTNTLSETTIYRYPEKDDPKAKTDLPLDKNNHAMDAKRYAIHNHEVILLAQQNREDKKGKRQRPTRERK
jgi:PBSX family phage terminase large subunit